MKSITTQELAALEGAIIIDVREDDEFATGHAEGAKNFPLSTFAEHFEEISKESPIYVICQSGGRSARACDYLEGQGYDATNVTGGTGDWIAGNLPVEK
jgi:rhodanese-related sulfurtransferase